MNKIFSYTYSGIKVILLIAAFSLVTSIESPILKSIMIPIWVIYLSYSLYSKVKYKKSNTGNICLETQNDRYLKVGKICISLIIIFAVVGFSIYYSRINYWVSLCLLIGILLFLNGIFSKKSVLLKIVGNQIWLSGLKNWIPLSDLQEIKITPDKISLTEFSERVHFVEDLIIGTPSARDISLYIAHANEEIKITNEVI